jgi:hypothetical protein
MQLSLQELAMAYTFSESAHLGTSQLATNVCGAYALFPDLYAAVAS